MPVEVTLLENAFHDEKLRARGREEAEANVSGKESSGGERSEARQQDNGG